MAVDSGKLGIDGSVELILNAIRVWCDVRGPLGGPLFSEKDLKIHDFLLTRPGKRATILQDIVLWEKTGYNNLF